MGDTDKRFIKLKPMMVMLKIINGFATTATTIRKSTAAAK
jgi:hypothetical protein